MEKTAKEIADIIVQATFEYTDLYCMAHSKKFIDKQIWAALHMGMVTAFKECGYSDKLLDKALVIAQKKILEEYE